MHEIISRIANRSTTYVFDRKIIRIGNIIYINYGLIFTVNLSAGERNLSGSTSKILIFSPVQQIAGDPD